MNIQRSEGRLYMIFVRNKGIFCQIHKRYQEGRQTRIDTSYEQNYPKWVLYLKQPEHGLPASVRSQHVKYFKKKKSKKEQIWIKQIYVKPVI